jgi:hypothetical protein
MFSTTEVETLDICVGAVYITTVDAGASTPGGVPCFDMDEFILEIPTIEPECHVDVSGHKIEI